MPDCDLTWVGSRDSALGALAGETFDLVILDEQIPSADGVLERTMRIMAGAFLPMYARSSPARPVGF